MNSTGARTVFLFSVVPRTVTDPQNVKKRSEEEREEEKKEGNLANELISLKSQLSHLKNGIKNHTCLI